MYTKKEIADSISKFISNDLMNDVDDKHLKFTLCMAKKALHENPDILDGFLQSPLVANVITHQDDMYNVDMFVKIMKNVISEYGSYSVMIPKIPMFAPKDCMIQVTVADVEKIVEYLSGQTATSV